MRKAIKRKGTQRFTYQVEILPKELSLDNSVHTKSDRLRFAVIRKKKNKISQVAVWKNNRAQWDTPIVLKATIFREKSGLCQSKIYRLLVQTDARKPKSVAAFEIDISKYAGHTAEDKTLKLRATRKSCKDENAYVLLGVRVSFKCEGGPGSESDCSQLSDSIGTGGLGAQTPRLQACPMSPVVERKDVVGESSGVAALAASNPFSKGENPFAAAIEEAANSPGSPPAAMSASTAATTAPVISTSNPFAKISEIKGSEIPEVASVSDRSDASHQDLTGFQEELEEADRVCTLEEELKEQQHKWDQQQQQITKQEQAMLALQEQATNTITALEEEKTHLQEKLTEVEQKHEQTKDDLKKKMQVLRTESSADEQSALAAKSELQRQQQQAVEAAVAEAVTKAVAEAEQEVSTIPSYSTGITYHIICANILSIPILPYDFHFMCNCHSSTSGRASHTPSSTPMLWRHS